MIKMVLCTGVVEINDWIIENLSSGQSVGVDPYLMSANAARALENKLKAKNVILVPMEENIVDQVWSDRRPSPSTAEIICHPLDLSGESTQSKIERIKAKMRSTGIEALVISMLDEVETILYFYFIICVHMHLT